MKARSLWSDWSFYLLAFVGGVAVSAVCDRFGASALVSMLASVAVGGAIGAGLAIRDIRRRGRSEP